MTITHVYTVNIMRTKRRYFKKKKAQVTKLFKSHNNVQLCNYIITNY